MVLVFSHCDILEEKHIRDGRDDWKWHQILPVLKYMLKKKKSATLSLCSEQNISVCEIAVAMTTRGCSPLTRVPKKNKS